MGHINCPSVWCSSLPPSWRKITTETQFPLKPGSEVALKCSPGHTLTGDSAVTCLEGTTFSYTNTPTCTLGLVINVSLYDSRNLERCSAQILIWIPIAEVCSSFPTLCFRWMQYAANSRAPGYHNPVSSALQHPGCSAVWWGVLLNGSWCNHLYHWQWVSVGAQSTTFLQREWVFCHCMKTIFSFYSMT